MKKINLRSRGKLTGAMTLLICLFFLVVAANATVIYDNLGSPSDGVDPLMAQAIVQPDGSTVNWPGGPLFNSFSTGATDFHFWDVKLLMKRDPGTPSSFSVALYNDSTMTPGTPGTLLAQIGTRSDSVLSEETLSTVDFPLASDILLAAHTRYWIVLYSTDNSTPSTANWSWSLDETAVGVNGEYHGYYYNNIGYFWPNVGGVFPGAYQMWIPLPGTLLLLGSGLAGLGLWRVRKRFKKA